tara:strand:- start:2610 stop:4124 length:1515 start_codon:yes stop_codon:yes gene_type:complete
MKYSYLALFLYLFLVSSPALCIEPLDYREDLTIEEKLKAYKVMLPTTDFSKAEKYEAMSMGEGTSKASINRNSFSRPSENLSFEGKSDFAVGNGLFKKLWVSSPSSTLASDGLGPLFNSRSCQSCHIKDGRGHPPDIQNAKGSSMVFQLSLEPQSLGKQSLNEEVFIEIPDPIYGHQLQDFAVPGLEAEGQIKVSYTNVEIKMNGGEIVNLRIPEYIISDLAYGDLNPNVRISARVAQQMIGLGLLEAIHPGDILALEDITDSNGDGISGRASIIINSMTEKPDVGRFGWKASSPTLWIQGAKAFANDIGISNPVFTSPHGDCTTFQKTCLEKPDGIQMHLGKTEAPDPVMKLISWYSSNLAVPSRRKVNDFNILEGKKLFYNSGCTSCHTPKFVTQKVSMNDPHSFQLIWPYTDMLLHDMGEGLSDQTIEGEYLYTEWRTPPLWGIGLTKKVSGHTFFLHDGRARNLLEAIIWHGGEAEKSKNKVIAMSPVERKYLLAFLESL